MPISRQDVQDHLSRQPAHALHALLTANNHTPKGQTSKDLAAQITTLLWWHHASPLGLAVRTYTLDNMVKEAAKQLKLAYLLTETDPWSQLTELTHAVVGAPQHTSPPRPLSEVASELNASWWKTSALGSTGAVSLGVGFAGRRFIAATANNIGRALPWVPGVGPVFLSLRKGAGVAAAVGGPLGWTLTALSLNEALGASAPKWIPLLLGIGALAPPQIAEATEISPR